jgi:hypothetical protein
VSAAGNLEERGKGVAGDSEIFLEFESVESGGHNDELEVWATASKGLENPHEDVSSKGAFVSVVDNDGGVATEFRVVHGFAEEYAVSHVFNECSALLGHVFKTYRVTDLLAELD